MSSRSRAARNRRGGWAFLGRIVVPSRFASRDFPRTSARRGGDGDGEHRSGRCLRRPIDRRRRTRPPRDGVRHLAPQAPRRRARRDQRREHGGVAAVHVLAPVQPPLGVGEGRAVNEVHGHRLVEHHAGFAAGAPDAVQQRLGIGLLGPEQDLGELHRLGQADAAVAEGAPVAREEAPLGRVVQVDVVPVGEHELDATQRVARPRRLAHGEGKGARGVLGEPGRAVGRAALAVGDGEAAQRARVAPEARQILLHHDGARHVPGRVDDEVLHHVGELGRLAPLCVLSDHGPRAEGLAALVHDGGREVREVDPDVARAAVEVEPALALHGDEHLAEPLLGGHVERGQRRGAGDAVGLQPRALLERGHRADERLVVEGRERAGHEAHRREPVAQGDHGGAVVAGAQDAGLGHRRPPAARGHGALQRRAMAHQTGVFGRARGQGAQDAGRILLLDPPQEDARLGARDLAHHGGRDLARVEDAAAQNGRVVEIRRRQRGLGRPGLARVAHQRQLRPERVHVPARGRQAVVGRARQRRQERRDALLGRLAPRPKRREAPLAVEGGRALALGHRLGHGLLEGHGRRLGPRRAGGEGERRARGEGRATQGRKNHRGLQGRTAAAAAWFETARRGVKDTG